MTSYTFSIDQYQYARAIKPVRTRFDVIEIWMELAKLIINYYPPQEQFIHASLKVISTRMSRVFVSTEEKVFSIAFPFRIEVEGDQFQLTSSHGIPIDSQVTSEVLLATSAFRGQGIQTEWDLIQYFDDQGGASQTFWSLFTEMLDAEDGYLRFDHDPAQRNGHLHPLNHADIFYTNGSSFKIGFRERPTMERMIDILNRETNCHYLEVPIAEL
ncbi:hypothetical protein [Pseudomonas phenolilytica]|uniref:hypothetical protein n=1 Tax=Pseudomonas phenolilytica TaxID=2746321 RepID=UPI001F38F683|nr:hypothetical protein [Pseudomonas phenolilytica]UIP86924.1 hypothetical protein HU825_10305 [Pseudomonas phenolilytica]